MFFLSFNYALHAINCVRTDVPVVIGVQKIPTTIPEKVSEATVDKDQVIMSNDDHANEYEVNNEAHNAEEIPDVSQNIGTIKG